MPKTNDRREGLLWLMVSEISAHGCLALLLWACGEAEHYGGECMAEELLTFGRLETKKRKGKGLEF